LIRDRFAALGIPVRLTMLRIFNSGLGTLADNSIDLHPEDLRTDIDALNDRIYPKLNNGIYRTGFAITQLAYEEAFADVFAMPDELETRLENQGPYLFDDRLTEHMCGCSSSFPLRCCL
jgi:putative glutathione S-transferase